MKNYLFASVLFFSSIAGQAQFSETTNPFSGFTVMSLPRTAITIGAIWNTTLGTIGEGAPSQYISEQGSSSALHLMQNKQFKTDMEAGVLNFFKGSGAYSSLKDVRVDLEGVSIVTINSYEHLKNNVGNTILYEAIRAGSIKMTAKKERVADASTALSSLFKNFEVTASYDNGDESTLQIEGIDLFIAYRLIKVENQIKKQNRLKFKSQGKPQGGSYVLSSVYESNTPDLSIQICPCKAMKCMQDKGPKTREDAQHLLSACASNIGYDMTVVFKNKTNPKTGLPYSYSFAVKAPSSIRNKFINLYSNNTSDGLEIAYLNIEKMLYTVINTNLVFLENRKNDNIVYLTTIKFAVSTPAFTKVAGW